MTIAVVTTAVAVSACERAEAEPPLANSFPSAGRLAEAALAALEAGDRQELERMMVTRDEYENLLWDQLPESHSLPLDYVWMLNQKNSSRALDRAIENLQGVHFDLMDVTFREPVEEYDGFRIHIGARTLVRRSSDGAQGEIPLLDVMVERGGRWKLLNFGD